MLSCNRCMAFSWKSAFKQLSEYPLCLAVGDVSANLQQLMDKDPSQIHEPTARQLRQAISAGWPLPAAVEHVQFLEEMGFSTDMVEQAHGFGRSTLLSHSQLGLPMLAARSLILQSFSAFSAMTEQRQIQQLHQMVRSKQEQLNKRFSYMDLFRQRVLQVCPITSLSKYPVFLQ